MALVILTLMKVAMGSGFLDFIKIVPSISGESFWEWAV